MEQWMRVWIFNPFDDVPGEGKPQRYWTLAEELAATGNQVVWWSSDWSHRRKARRRIREAEGKWNLASRDPHPETRIPHPPSQVSGLSSQPSNPSHPASRPAFLYARAMTPTYDLVTVVHAATRLKEAGRPPGRRITPARWRNHESGFCTRGFMRTVRCQ